MIIIGFHGTNITDRGLEDLRRQIIVGEIGGVIFFSYNIVNQSQIKNFIKDIKKLRSDFPLLAAVDEEGGSVSRFTKEKGFEVFPSASEIAKAKKIEDAYAIYKRMAKQLRYLGFNLNLGPVLDLDFEGSPIIGQKGRSYSKDPETVYLFARLFIKAHNKEDVLTAVKHFPGHGSAASDTHTDFTDITSVWNKNELVPFRRMISDGKVDIVMTGHLYNNLKDWQYPASLSRIHIQNILRKKLDYKGVVMSDDLQMNSIIKKYSLDEIVTAAINSGTDLMLFGNYEDKLDKDLPGKIKKIIIYGIQEGKISQNSIDSSFKRILDLKKKIVH